VAKKGDRGQEYYENEVERFRKMNVSQDNFVDFLNDIEGTIKEVDSAISELNTEKNRAEQSIQKTKDEFGEDNLDQLRNKGNGRWNHDLLQLSQDKDTKIEVLEELKDRQQARGDLHDIRAKKVVPILEHMDAHQIRSQVYEQMNELTEKRIDNSEEKLLTQIDGVRSRMQSVEDELTRQIRDIRDASRRERDSNATEMMEFMERVIHKLDGTDVKTSDLETHKENISNGEEVDSVSLGVHHDEDDDEAGSSSIGSDSGVEGTQVKTSNRKQIKEELRKLENDESEYSSQGEIAKEFGVSDGRVSQIKSEMD